MKDISAYLFFFLVAITAHAQVYVEKQSRHRFAQLNLGLDITASNGGTTYYQNNIGQTEQLSLIPNISPRILIGGTHFWGHADFQIAIPLFHQTQSEDNQEIESYRGVETSFKYYPWRIEHRKIRPYVGAAITPVHHTQNNGNLSFGNGPDLTRVDFPLMAGALYNVKNHLFELGVTWHYNNTTDYAISRDTWQSIETPPLYVSLAYNYMLETTLSAEKSWESGAAAKATERLAQKKKLNGFFIGTGISSAFWLKESGYNETFRPYVENYGINVMPDFTLGYYWNNIDVNVGLAYRGYREETTAYRAAQEVRRRSLVLEATKYLFDYNGFVPFIGPAASYEQLHFEETFEGNPSQDITTSTFAYAVTFGWDIRPNRLQAWVLRTNLRWFPNLNLDTEQGTSIAFDALEFNFIQLIIYPNRLF